MVVDEARDEAILAVSGLLPVVGTTPRDTTLPNRDMADPEARRAFAARNSNWRTFEKS